MGIARARDPDSRGSLRLKNPEFFLPPLPDSSTSKLP